MKRSRYVRVTLKIPNDIIIVAPNPSKAIKALLTAALIEYRIEVIRVIIGEVSDGSLCAV